MAWLEATYTLSWCGEGFMGCRWLCPSCLCTVEKEVSLRISNVRVAFFNLEHLWYQRDICIHLKLGVYNSTVRTVLLSGYEALRLHFENIRRLFVVGETEPLEVKNQMLTGSPILPITRTSEATPLESNCTATPALSGRFSIATGAQVTPIEEKNNAVSSTPFITRSSTGALAYDSEPGLHSSHHISSETHSRCWELPETQPEVPAESEVFVEESELFWAPITANQHQDLQNDNRYVLHSKLSAEQSPKDNQLTADKSLSSQGHPSLDSEPVDLIIQESQCNSGSQMVELTQPMIGTPLLVVSDHSPAPSFQDNLSGVGRTGNRPSVLSTTPNADVADDFGDLTQPMVQMSTARKRRFVKLDTVVDLDVSALEEPQVNGSKSPVNQTSIVDGSPHESVVHYPRLGSKPTDNDPDPSTGCALMAEHEDDGLDELTQPMLHIRPVVLDELSTASPPEGRCSFQLTSEVRPTPQTTGKLNMPVHRLNATPPNADDAVTTNNRLAKTTVKRNQVRQPRSSVAGRVSSLFLTKSIGVVQFRSRRGNDSSIDKDSEDSLLEGKDIYALPGPSFGLVRRASQAFPVTAAAADSNILTHLVSGHKRSVNRFSKRSHSKKARVLQIPSPVHLPDSILSEDPSQHEISVEASHEVNRSSAKPPLPSAPLVGSATTVSPTLVLTAGKSNEHLFTPMQSAVTSAGFEYSPQDTEIKVSPKPLDISNHCFQINSTPVPVVDLSSFSDLMDSHLSKQKGRSSTAFRSSIPVSPSPEYKRRGARSRKRIDSSPVATMTPKHPEAGGPDRKKRKRRSPAASPVRRSRRITMDIKPPVERIDAPSKSPASKPVRRTARLSSIVKAVQPTASTRTRRLTPLGQKIDIGSKLDDASFVLLERCTPKAELQLLFSGVDSSRFNQIFPALGACETDDVMLATHLITDRWKRTIKMLYARARGIPIISQDWLTTCVRTRKKPYPDPMKFRLSEPSPPSPPGCRTGRPSRPLKAPEKVEQTNFLRGWSISSTLGVSPAPDDLARLTELAGGRWKPYSELLHSSGHEKHHKAVVVTTEKDLFEVQSGRRKRGSKLPPSLNMPSVSMEWFLQTIMRRVPPRWPVDDLFLVR
ncbi:Mediator of DNA damage checkpoint protein 1 [Clonorchis sinensis]|uniref:PAX-interacting protein 1 n=1 Tax=Clonorchis sinensis TaxID=79923 RepID=A0A419Q5N4_CLOSI|nr:Mediator of DNA damage checkpoint protein 1 [Clonorchis sinensis]